MERERRERWERERGEKGERDGEREIREKEMQRE